MTVTNLCNEVLENAIGVHRNLEKIEPLYPMDAVAVQAMEELLKYRAIGTVEEFKALKEKNEPKKAIKNNPIINNFWSEESMLCPKCHGWVSRLGYCFCDKCGQKLDWRNE